MNYIIKKASLAGRLKIPPSKSQTLRAILFGTLGKGVTKIDHYLHSPDTDAMIRACTLLGATINQNTESLSIFGCNGEIKAVDDVIHAGNSGIVLRFITAIAAHSHAYTVITGDHSIRHQRPMQPLLSALTQLGTWTASTRNNGYAPLMIKGPLQPGTARLCGIDSQPVSSLLIAAAFTKGPTTLFVKDPGEKPWINLTTSWFDRLGIPYQNHDYTHYQLSGHAQYDGFYYEVPGDLSSLAFPLAAALITHSELIVEGVDLTDMQGDKKLIFILQKMGASIEVDEKSRTLHVKKGNQLTGMEIDVNDFIDSIPILAVIGCYAEGKTHLKNAKVARQKECDRLHCITLELTKMGARIEEEEDGLVIHHSVLHAAKVSSHSDHRIAMALSVAALAIEGETYIEGIQCINKTYPNFSDQLNRLGATIKCV